MGKMAYDLDSNAMKPFFTMSNVDEKCVFVTELSKTDVDFVDWMFNHAFDTSVAACTAYTPCYR